MEHIYLDIGPIVSIKLLLTLDTHLKGVRKLRLLTRMCLSFCIKEKGPPSYNPKISLTAVQILIIKPGSINIDVCLPGVWLTSEELITSGQGVSRSLEWGKHKRWVEFDVHLSFFLKCQLNKNRLWSCLYVQLSFSKYYGKEPWPYLYRVSLNDLNFGSLPLWQEKVTQKRKKLV